ncbi:hypothetical protein C7959_10348 [Orenia marismortui]|uniref:HD-GYP domain-containing protein n=1 Tax=Orenia marismortui TaxID=46469 RepID=A0A4R8H6J1_9FIRM|nr:hypothetical protein [Orenia marismortui]TDX53196.1 hypothetical protein C7959_10348 [Orenia marismortui]
MAVSDVFTALSEDRPYRKGMEKDKVLEIIKSMVEDNKLDDRIVAILIDNYDQINLLRKGAQENAVKEYQELF